MSTNNNVTEWSGDFGDKYHYRNFSSWKGVKNRARLFETIIEKTEPHFPTSILECGAGCGDNLRAIDTIYERTRTPVKLMACEPNEIARQAIGDVAETTGDILGKLPYLDSTADLVFTSGVLIHIPPDELGTAMDEIHRVSSRWILSIEYFNPSPDEVCYHGMQKMLWRRDFGEAWLERYPDLKPTGCGFAWKRLTGLDNVTWWLFEKP